MSALSVFALLGTVFITSTISGVFGMAGGVILMGVLAALMPVPAAMVTHGAVQLVANGSRAALHRAHIAWGVMGFYAAGAAAALILASWAAFAPSSGFVHLSLAGVSFLVWLPARAFALNAERPAHAALCGFSVTGVNILAGVAGPLLDVFFVRTGLTRHQIVATKAATQVLAHLAKVVFYGGALSAFGAGHGLPAWWVFAMAAPLSLLGTALGGRILDRMSDRGFLAWSKWLITAMGVFYLWRGLALLSGI